MALSTIFLIRHGQASFGADDYDVLSTVGAEQGRELGRYWARRQVRLDACYRGPRRRHADTAAGFLEGASEAGVSYPDTTTLDGLDEYPAIELLKRWLPKLTAEHPELASAFGAGASQRQFEQGFRLVIDKWSRGELETGDLETFEHFQGRVRAALDHIMTTEGRKKQVAVFTSGGPIAMAMQRALELSSELALRTAWVVANGSINEFRYRDTSEFTLVRFNAIPHLQDDALITYR